MYSRRYGPPEPGRSSQSATVRCVRRFTDSAALEEISGQTRVEGSTGSQSYSGGGRSCSKCDVEPSGHANVGTQFVVR
jgi:hypothetical protein